MNHKFRFALCTWVLLITLEKEVLARTSDSLRVKINSGPIVGRHLSTHSGRPIRAFMGIPYAQPPIGDLRFKQAVPPLPWTEDKHVVESSEICSQRMPYTRDMNVNGGEDCLYLNVYTPTTSKNDTALKPVMVFFHGGGWMCNAGNRENYGPDFLLEHDVVFVAGNYRLGPLGFLSTGTDDCPGNNGLKDQIMILKWIQKNIKHFGGNPNSVTVFGESAGGATVTYLLMSPLSKGLFHRVISESGVNLDAWAAPAHKGIAPARALKLGEIVGCKVKKNDKTQWPHLIKCLREKPAEDITKAFYDFFEWDMDPMIPFPPVVEHDHPGAYITKHPRDEMAPHGLSMPWIVSINTDEGSMKTANFAVDPELMQDLNSNWDRAWPIMLYYDHLPVDKQKEFTQAINEFYFKNQSSVDMNNLQNYTNAVSDGWFWHGMENYLRIRLEKSDQEKVGPTYVMLYTHKGSASFTELFLGGHENYYGVCHADELQSLFPVADELFMSAIPTEEDIEVRRAMTKMWTDFATTGNPTPNDSKLPKWLPTKGFPLDYYRIGTKDFEGQAPLAMERGLFEERAAFWNKYKPHLHD